MKKIFTFFLATTIFMLAIIGCKNDNKVMPSESDAQESVEPERTDKLPFACDMVTESQMLKIMDKDVKMEILDGNRNKTSENSTSCFYKWDDANGESVGVMISVSRNPLPDEINNYVTTYMNHKKFNGENSYENTELVYKYQELENAPFPAIYNHEISRYYFGVGEEYLCNVIFNYPATPEKLDTWFIGIAEKMKKAF